MEDKTTYSSPLEEKYSHAILLTLLENPYQKKTDLLQNISKSSCMPNRLSELERYGLVQITRNTFNYNTKLVSLTERGEKVALLLKQIYELI
jgi:DNA-binding HxlR family transcriptional regulator